VSTGSIGGVLADAADPAEAVGQLVGLAEEAGAPDNISAIVIDVSGGCGEPAAAGPVMLGAAAAEALTR
jgi:protein phosphatase